MFLKRAFHHACWRLRPAWRKFFLRGMVIPWMRIWGILSGPISIRPAHSGAVIIDREHVYKLSLDGKRTVESEYQRYVNSIDRWPQLSTILPDCRMRDAGFFGLLEMSRYQPLDLEETVEHATNLYGFMRNLGTPNSKNLALPDSKELDVGIEYIAKLYGESVGWAIRAEVESYLESGAYHLGFAHGDFHSRNIMVDGVGRTRLIDLDCIRLNGIQELDALYFVLEMEWSKSGTIWYRTLFEFLKGNLIADYRAILGRFGVECSFPLCVTYLADRLGQETGNFGLIYTRTMLDPVIGEIVTRASGRRRIGENAND